MNKLYKYRTINEYTIKSLIDKSIWMAAPDCFNDPYDCNLGDEYKIFSGETIVEDESGKVQKYNQEYYNKVIYKSFLENGIGCFCESPMEILMWSHYVANHSGICLEYDLSICDEELRSLFHRVNYVEKYPKINFQEFFNDMQGYLFKALYSKYKVWDYEKEWRLIMPGMNNQAFYYPENFLSSIYLGCRISDQDRQKIIELFANSEKRPNIYQCYKKNNSFEMSYAKIEDIWNKEVKKENRQAPNDELQEKREKPKGRDRFTERELQLDKEVSR